MKKLFYLLFWKTSRVIIDLFIRFSFDEIAIRDDKPFEFNRFRVLWKTNH